ncbi:MAG TPA: ATP-binding protein [Terriglobia bacterium]|nr:ATP-binding protein [Terriglobia bacterium]
MEAADQRRAPLSNKTANGLNGNRSDRGFRRLGSVSSKRANPPSALLASDFTSLRQQESIFVTLNLFVLAILLLIHTLFSSHWGSPSPVLIVVLSFAFVAQVGELVWLQARRDPLEPWAIMALTGFSIVMNIGLAVLLAELSHREDIQYFIILVVPILQAAFRLPLVPTIAVICVADFVTFFWVWEYERHHPVLRPGEYFESGTVSLIYTVMGVLVWLLVNQLEQREIRLSESLKQLERAKERLLGEEKLAAVGRLSSAIAHEIRNPVAMIASALSTANRAGIQVSEREEMFDIAAKEAARLEKLTTDFLVYARPRGLEKTPSAIAEMLGYVADVCRPRSGERGVSIAAESAEMRANLDAAQVQQALINLVMNAVEASPPAGRVILRAIPAGDGLIQIDVEDAAGPIPAEVVSRMFEPFFTTKASGTGLGLAIARNIARAHGGDLVLSLNEPGRVYFSLTLPAAAPDSTST